MVKREKLYEKYRPTQFGDVIGQDKATGQIQQILSRGWGGSAWWIAGPSGSGKTTIARIIASHGADDWMIREYDSADQLTGSALDQIEYDMTLCAPGKGGRAYIVNEAHGLKAAIIRRLLGLLERIPGHVCWVFTTTKSGQAGLFEDQIDADPLLSRCDDIQLTGQGLAKPFAEHVQRIAHAEGLDGKPIAAYIKLAQECHNNMRMMLQSVERGQMQK